ncbi:mechanosensitive ion channel family protein [Glaesserella parasuis]|uniref:mechanosensitive ion channel family protein n=1 Tax=Glaesserella parasuis TaxID=738 RepID=UPI0003ABF348|nr:mechanosensitive ion channel domain-containing protein [Glaesserella parasuis]EQA10213.1 mechanosensitive ion channel family protein [Glaesserella parasuis H465]MCT8525005.1 mechanosensitive ion channel [Glaesserella parasuis]MCT8526950.1 mechanosensitive ion channel [Glaesserella parasuis]MCT8529356.1 mechanosensitive ion channel [Glaesserella parasuis]MCT8531182.1 mechanosensitive ion channel [Glaesserella parasuis]
MSTTEKTKEIIPEITLPPEAKEIITDVKNLELQQLLENWIIPYGTKLLIAIAIFVIGRYLARTISTLIGKAVLASSKDEMLQGFVRSIAYFLFLLITVIASLSQLGINTSSLVALIGAAGLAIGLALQNSLQNFAAGVMLLIFKPFNKGDFIEAGGKSGKVEQMGILMLELRTVDNKTVLIPNSKVFADSITNYSRNETRRIDFIFDISYESDIEKAKEIIAQILFEDENVLHYPEPTIAVGNLAASSVQLFVRPWVQTNNYSTTQFAILEKVKIGFDKAGISIPYNQLDLHLPEQTSVTFTK